MRVTNRNTNNDKVRYAKGFSPVDFSSVLGKRSSSALGEAVKKRFIDSKLRYRRADEYVKRVKMDHGVDVRGVTVVSDGFNKGCLRVSARGALKATVNIPEGTIFHTGQNVQNLAVVKGFKGVVEKGNDLVLDAYCMDLRFGCPHGVAKPTHLKVKQKMSSFGGQSAFWDWMAPCNDVRVIVKKGEKDVTEEERPPKIPGVRKSCGELFRMGVTNDAIPESDSDSDSSDSDSDDSDDGSSRKRTKKRRRKARRRMLKKRYKPKGYYARHNAHRGKKSRYVCPRDGRGDPLASEKNTNKGWAKMGRIPVPGGFPMGEGGHRAGGSRTQISRQGAGVKALARALASRRLNNRKARRDSDSSDSE